MTQPPKSTLAMALILAVVPAGPLQAGGKAFGRKAVVAAAAAAAGLAAAEPLPHAAGRLPAGLYAAVPGALGPEGGTLMVLRDPGATHPAPAPIPAAALAPRMDPGPLHGKILEALADYRGRNVVPAFRTFDFLAQDLSGPNEFRFATPAAEAAALRVRLEHAGGRGVVRDHVEYATKLARCLDQYAMTALEEWVASAGSGRDAVLLDRLVKIAEYLGLNAEFEAKLSLALRGRLADQLSGRRPLGKGRTRAQVQEDKLAVEKCHGLLTSALHSFSSNVIPLVLDLTGPGPERVGDPVPPEAVAARETWVAGPPPRDPVEAIEGVELR
jgi:hypothetical protein